MNIAMNLHTSPAFVPAFERGTMRVAFDVQGTIVGPHSEKVLALFKWFEAKGAEMTVWTFGMLRDASKAVARAGIDRDIDVVSKYSRFDAEAEDKPIFNVAVDDDWAAPRLLAADHVINVTQIPENPEDFDRVFGHLVRESA